MGPSLQSPGQFEWSGSTQEIRLSLGHLHWSPRRPCAFAHSFRVPQPVPVHTVLNVIRYNVSLRVGAMCNVHVVTGRRNDLLDWARDVNELPVNAVPSMGETTAKRSLVVENLIPLAIRRQTFRIHVATVAQNLHVLCSLFDYSEFIFGQCVVLYNTVKRFH